MFPRTMMIAALYYCSNVLHCIGTVSMHEGVDIQNVDDPFVHVGVHSIYVHLPTL